MGGELHFPGIVFKYFVFLFKCFRNWCSSVAKYAMGNDKKLNFELEGPLCIISDTEKKSFLTIDLHGSWTFSDPQFTLLPKERLTGEDFFCFIKIAIKRCQEDSKDASKNQTAKR